MDHEMTEPRVVTGDALAKEWTRTASLTWPTPQA